ncbi:NADH:flavin oxidoreductase/nadh oxidase family protein [Luminiphilus syltensis NOR5-1B]|uniref:NADH:flavin oxidoreductase/nadh oxidase family protein n=1 Tax=Luminiphilus syltensis NOR5-1B TaxID=565045 RepID=B8KYN5_9GAMM|nr:NADH:flavin oxidoreductase [Luminiphilus syltensis]EED34151.1 NADH:flavin oxidoreductase/nadh oxidase family protein [Luminiphilus syltensis NOR5-1B]
MPTLQEPLTLAHGPAWRNRFMLAALTNLQSAEDGVLSDDEYHWLTLRAEGGFGAVSTCAAHVRQRGIGFPGQLGIWDDRHLDGLTRLADKLNQEGAHSIVQLHHAGMRTPHDLIEGKPECPSDNDEFGAKAMPADDVEQLKDDFVTAARRAAKAGFDGVELHAAHGYILGQFLSSEINQRDDHYGGSLENRARILFDLVERVRDVAPADFSLGVRLSPERFGMQLDEVVEVARRLCADGLIDYIDLSLWDVFKTPADAESDEKTLLEFFTELDRRHVKLGGAGKIYNAADAQRALDSGLDFIILGRGAILHHDFPQQVARNPDFKAAELPVTAAHLKKEGLGPDFIDYMRGWDGFVSD